ncbi:MAG: type II toxin-antitoxin system VapC family toxin [Puniceicoccaceae bacterium]|nr:MAG: type II toxin-antitoxin system VapC family toxin [Puniceicoccaceae bacterium]
MNYCLDTNTVVYYLKGTCPEIRRRLQGTRPKNLFIPEIVYAELLYGVANSQRKVENAAKLEAFVQPIERISFDERASPHYADIRADLTKRGQLIGSNVLLIASIARAHSMTLITHNTNEFKRIAGLQIEDWAFELE